MKPKVTLILPNYNGEKFLKTTIESILDTAGYPVELIVIDDGSTDNSVEIARKIKGIKLIEKKKNEGVPKALNLGFELAGDSDVVRLDNDIQVLTNNWVEKLIDLAYSSPDIGIVGVKILLPDGRIQCVGQSVISGIGIRPPHADIGFGEVDKGQYDGVHQVDAVSGPMAYIKNELIKKLKDDENYSPVWYEDLDYCISARAMGYDVFVQPEVKIVHYGFTKPAKLSSERIKRELRKRFDYWKKKWGWDPEYPDLHLIRNLWGHTKICWRISEPLLIEDENPYVDVLIVTWNNKEGLSKCLDSIGRTTYGKLRVWILDNGSTDGTSEFLDNFFKNSAFKFPFKVIRTPVNIGLPAGLNWLIKISDAPLVARLDDDVIVPPNWLEILVEDLLKHPYAGAVGCKVLELQNPNKIQTAEIRLFPEWSAHTGEIDLGMYNYIALTNHVSGCCVLYKRKIFEKVGYFDIRFSPTQHDDLDNFVAIRVAGYDVLYDGRVGVLHPLTSGADKSIKAITNSRANFIKLLGKWGDDVFEILEKSLDLAGRRNTHPKLIDKNYAEISAKVEKLCENNKIDEAVKLLENFLLGDFPAEDKSKAYNDLGVLYARKGDWESALRCFQKSVEIDEKNLTALKNLAEVLLEVERFEDALKTYHRILSLKPDDTETLLYLGEIYFYAERKDEAKKFFELVLMYQPENERAKFYLSEINQNDHLELVSIIIPVHNQLEYTKLCIESIKKNTNFQFEIIVVDNASSDGTYEYLSSMPDVRLIRNEINFGFPKAVNQGLAESKGNYIVILNNDVIVPKGWLERLIEAMREKDLDIVAPVSNYASGIQMLKGVEKFYQVDGKVDENRLQQLADYLYNENKSRVVEFPKVIGLCMLIRRKVVDKIGGFDERFGLGNYEDDDFCVRAMIAGFKIGVAYGVFIHHFGSKSFSASGAEKFRKILEHNRKVFIDKWGFTPEEIFVQKMKPRDTEIFIPIK